MLFYLLMLLIPGPQVPHSGDPFLPPVFTMRSLAAGDSLWTVISANVHEEPSRTSPLVARYAPGRVLLPVETHNADASCWVRVEEGWIEAARLDHLPRVATDREVGRECMEAGRPLPVDYRPEDLVAVPDSLKAPGYEGRAMRLRAGALAAVAELLAAAGAAGHDVRIISAFRSAPYQRKLYAKAVDRDPAQNYSAAPGRSEHQLGTTVDIAVAGERAFHPSLGNTPGGRWIAENAPAFGIVQPFGNGRATRPRVLREPWHLRWVAGRLDEDLW
ncbi:MAG: hypothetical protein HKN12_05470 [Gemmatimonadetes bacterium]|nr:hypothetical protein [Gemmatimonadota bacterium]